MTKYQAIEIADQLINRLGTDIIVADLLELLGGEKLSEVFYNVADMHELTGSIFWANEVEEVPDDDFIF